MDGLVSGYIQLVLNEQYVNHKYLYISLFAYVKNRVAPSCSLSLWVVQFLNIDIRYQRHTIINGEFCITITGPSLNMTYQYATTVHQYVCKTNKSFVRPPRLCSRISPTNVEPNLHILFCLPGTSFSLVLCTQA